MVRMLSPPRILWQPRTLSCESVTAVAACVSVADWSRTALGRQVWAEVQLQPDFGFLFLSVSVPMLILQVFDAANHP